MNNIPEHKTYRSRPADKTLEIIKPYLKEMGITRLANITGLDEISIPVYVAVRPNSKSLSLSQGKGISSSHAKVSALMETIESYHAENVDSDVIKSSLADLDSAGVPVCNYHEIPSLKGNQLDTLEQRAWITGINILNGKEILVPYESVHVDMTKGSIPYSEYFIQGSNGLASGNTHQEALNHAVCEIIERDAYSCWSLLPAKEKSLRKVKISTIDCPTCLTLIEKFEQGNSFVAIWDITSDINIPAFLARVISKDSPPFCQIRPASGFGCHPDKNIALIRAITEAAQSRLTFIAGARDDMRLSHYAKFLSIKEYQKWHAAIVEEAESVNFKNIAECQAEHAESIWNILREALQKVQIEEIISVDLLKSSFQIPVTKVIIPGLEGGEPYHVMNMGKRAHNIINDYYDEEFAQYA